MIGCDRPVDVVGDEEIELAVVVVVEPHGAGGKSGIGDAGFGGHIGKLAVAQIAEEMIRSEGGDVDVVVAVVVVVADGAAQPVHFDRESGLPGHVGERAVFVVVIERRKRLAGLVFRPIHGVDEENVLPAIVVVVEKANAAAHGFGKILFSEGAGVVLEVDAGLRGHVGELDGAGGARRFDSRGG